MEAMSMCSLQVIFFLSCLLIRLVPLTAEDYPKEECISGSGNYTDGSSYLADLSSLLTSFSNAQVQYGFYNSSVGEVNGIGLCRGDIAPDDCRSCIGNSSHDILRLCPNYKEAILYQENCTLRYSNRSILGRKEYQPNYILYDVNNFSNPEIPTAVDTFFSGLAERAASGDTRWKYAADKTVVDMQTIYALVQCTPDLKYQDCVDCVNDLRGDASFMSSQGGTAMAPSCGVRYQIYPFYESPPGTPAASPPGPPPPPLPNDVSTGAEQFL